MNEENKTNAVCQLLSTVCEKLKWVPPLLARLAVGWIFVQSGWGKIHNLERVTAFFAELGIPAANIQAPFVAGVELICGALVLIGLFTRIASIPLIGTMIVAIITAKRGDISEISDLFAMSEFLYIVLLSWLALAGAGAVSVDCFWCCRKKKDVV